jgi:hypothetical protein
MNELPSLLKHNHHGQGFDLPAQLIQQRREVVTTGVPVVDRLGETEWATEQEQPGLETEKQ